MLACFILRSFNLPLHTCLHHFILRYLRPGDSLPIGAATAAAQPTSLPAGWREKYAGAVHEPSTEENTVVVGVLPGPHANPDYFTDNAMDVFYDSPYQVHYNSNRSVSNGMV